MSLNHTSVDLNSSSPTVQLYANISPSAKIYWSSDNPGIATVGSNGLVTKQIKVGTATTTITASAFNNAIQTDCTVQATF